MTFAMTCSDMKRQEWIFEMSLNAFAGWFMMAALAMAGSGVKKWGTGLFNVSLLRNSIVKCHFVRRFVAGNS
jgi:hypothetical protein